MNYQLTNFTFLARTAPYGTNRCNLLMDIALASSIFEQKSNYVFMDDAIYQLLRNQNADHIQTKTCLLYTSPSPRDAHESRMPSSA